MTLTFEKRSYKSEIKEVDNGFPNKFSRRRNGDIISLASQPVYWHSVNTFKKTWCNSIEIVLWWYTSAVWLPYSIYGVYRYFKSTLRNFLHDSVQQLIIWYFLIEKRHWKVIKCVICASNHLVRATGVKYHLKNCHGKMYSNCDVITNSLYFAQKQVFPIHINECFWNSDIYARFMFGLWSKINSNSFNITFCLKIFILFLKNNFCMGWSFKIASCLWSHNISKFPL